MIIFQFRLSNHFPVILTLSTGVILLEELNWANLVSSEYENSILYVMFGATFFFQLYQGILMHTKLEDNMTRRTIFSYRSRKIIEIHDKISLEKGNFSRRYLHASLD